MVKPPFDRVVAVHGERVLRVCRAVLGPHADADDAWSETFLSALTAWPSLPEDANVEAWLVTIAHRKAVDATRARSRRPLPAGGAIQPDGGSATTPGPGVHDGHDALWEVLARLPVKQRHCIAYHYLAGLPYADVADIVGGSPAAARRAAADGMRTLREALAVPGAKGGELS